MGDLGAPRVAVAVVTMGNRPDEVDALLESVAKQDLAPARIVVVGNGCTLPDFAERLSLPGEVTLVELDENLGCPGGRNEALAKLREFGDTDIVVELDDDGLLVDPMCCAGSGTCSRPTRSSASSASASRTSTVRRSSGMCPGSAPPTR